MKIAFIGQKGMPATSGGVEKHVEELAVRLAARGHEVMAYTRPHYTPASSVSYRGVRLISLPSFVRKNIDAISHTFLACLDLVRRDVDIVHFHSIGPSSLIFLVRLLKPNARIVATFHSQDYCQDKWGAFARFYLKLSERIACTLADKTITVSGTLTRLVRERYGRNPEFIPNGVAEAEFLAPSLITKSWGLKGNDYILAISRLIPNKGLHLLVEAFTRLKTDKKLVIVGDSTFTDEYATSLKAQAAANPNIIFTGALSGPILKELLSNASLFAHPSNLEGLSIAVLEAMAYGKVCLVSDIEENLEAINRFGFTFANHDSSSLHDELVRLLDGSVDLAGIGAQGREYVMSRYDWQNLVTKIEAVYGSLLEKDVAGIIRRLSLAMRFATFL